MWAAAVLFATVDALNKSEQDLPDRTKEPGTANGHEDGATTTAYHI